MNKLSLSFTVTSGVLKGGFMHPVTHKTNTIKGVVLQEENTARGFFLSTNQSGGLLLRAQ